MGLGVFQWNPVWLCESRLTGNGLNSLGYSSNSNCNWNGTEVVEESGHNIVMVNFNYRVGLWGFLAGHEVSEKGDLNVGLLDQRQALKWVQQHIAKACRPAVVAAAAAARPLIASSR